MRVWAEKSSRNRFGGWYNPEAHMHYSGYAEAVANAKEMDRDRLIDLIESLFGWSTEGIPEYAKETVPLEELRAEALRQLDRDWLIPAGREGFYTNAED